MQAEVDLRGCTALISGASRGIGRAIAVALAKEGCNVAGMARSVEALRTAMKECEAFGVKTLALPMDLAGASHDSLGAAIDRCVKELGGLDILVNNAGVLGRTDSSLEEWEKCIEVDLLGVLRVTKLALPHLESSSRRKAIINIGSVSGILKMGGSAPYCAAKHGVVGFTGSLFESVRKNGIKMCCINPGFVNTDMVQSDSLDSSKMVQPEDVALTALFVIKFPETACPTEIELRPQRTPYIKE
ncbi:3-oxoacyl-[acyl-carrier-protein] reductase [Balamuthia mandrillaris]